uniref:Putative secreted peptide n=1 Tax=Anopheles braziliensis TaxID=58242 RepID=A0A2M3ZUU9_9DIPT
MMLSNFSFRGAIIAALAEPVVGSDEWICFTSLKMISCNAACFTAQIINCLMLRSVADGGKRRYRSFAWNRKLFMFIRAIYVVS